MASEDPAGVTRALTAAFIVGTAGPVVGIAITLLTKQIAMRWAFGVILVVTLAAGGWNWLMDLR